MHLYSTLLCIAVHPKHFTIMWGSLLNHHQCAGSTSMMRRLPQDNGASALTTHQLEVERRESHRDNQVYALTTHQLQVERRESHRDNQVYALTTHQLQVERRESHRVNQVCAHHTPATGGEERERHRANQVYALTTHQLQVERRERVIEPIKCMRSPHTSYRWRGERVIEPIKWRGLLRGHDWQGPVVGIWPGHRGYTPTLYEKCHGILNDHR